MKEMVKIISDSLVQENITIEEVITQVENTWRWYGEGKVIMPSKITLDMSSLDVRGWFNSMPSYIQDTDLAGLKFVGGFVDNKALGLPFIRAKLLLFDPRTGSMRALMGGDWISQFRTGAQPAIACKCLASSTDVVTIIGAGAQAYAALECMRRVLEMKEVRVCDIFPEARKNFIARTKKHMKRIDKLISNTIAKDVARNEFLAAENKGIRSPKLRKLTIEPSVPFDLELEEKADD